VVLYLLQRGDHRKHQQDICKIRRRNGFDRAINEYALDIQIISVCPIGNEKKYQRELIKEVKSEFEFRSAIGNSPFYDNEREIISIFMITVQITYLIETRRST
jgi:hypothetical protein